MAVYFMLNSHEIPRFSFSKNQEKYHKICWLLRFKKIPISTLINKTSIPLKIQLLVQSEIADSFLHTPTKTDFMNLKKL